MEKPQRVLPTSMGMGKNGPPDLSARGREIPQAELEARFQAFVDKAARTLADDLVNVLNKAYSLGVSLTVGEEDPDAAYELTWLFRDTWKAIDVEWFAGMGRWAVTEGE
jgi:hypothetical protein